jgi:hypothetical protein
MIRSFRFKGGTISKIESLDAGARDMMGRPHFPGISYKVVGRYSGEIFQLIHRG